MIIPSSLKYVRRISVIATYALVLAACSSNDDSVSDPSPDTATPTTITEVTYLVPLSAAQEVPPIVLPEATGEGNLVLDTSTGELSGSLSVSELTGTASMAHIHQAPAGENGDVIIALEGNTDGTIWTIPANTVLDTPQQAAFTTGGMYLNAHTATNPGGEVRGQIRITTEFSVVIENVSTPDTLPTSGDSVAVPLSPGAYLVHREDQNPLLEPRDPANAALEAVAEDGDASLFPETIPGSVIFNTPTGATEPGPLFPGDSYSFTFLASPGDSLAFVTMFVQSNDWFYSVTDDNNDSISLFDENGVAISGDVSDMLSLWESATELDEEPGTGPNQAPRQEAPNTGVSETGSVGSLLSKGISVVLNGDVIRMTITPN